MHSDDSNNGKLTIDFCSQFFYLIAFLVLDEEFATSGFYVREKSSDKKPGRENFIYIFLLHYTNVYNKIMFSVFISDSSDSGSKETDNTIKGKLLVIKKISMRLTLNVITI